MKNKVDVMVCVGCNNVLGDAVKICCPDSNYKPLREFIKLQEDRIIDKRKYLLKFSEFMNKTHHLSYLPEYIDKYLKL
tara:strand:- start:1118 stop:1351 length:234 start_codon:yes stop_codon:yes gene_type:complete